MAWLNITYDQVQFQAMTWFYYIFGLLLGSWLGYVPLLVLRILCCGPIALYLFYKGIYNFGPDHQKRSLWTILTQPVPDSTFYEEIEQPRL